jgi:hypothetical protein
MTAVMFFGGAWGYLGLLKLPVPPGQAAALPAAGGSLLSNSTALLALAVLAGTALLIGMLAVGPWFSPLATGLPGLLLLAWTSLYLVNVRQAVSYIPLRSHSFGAGWEALLFNGILGAVGVAMVIPVFIPSRWRRSRGMEVEAFTSEVDDYLAAVKPDEGPPRRVGRYREKPFPLAGDAMSGPVSDSARPVETTGVTGASRAPRNSGSFPAAISEQQRPTGPGPSRRDGDGPPWRRPDPSVG